MTHTTKHTTHWITRQGFRCTDIVDSVTKEDIGYFKDHSQALKAAAAPAMYEALQQAIDELADYEAARNDPKSITRYRCEAALAQAEGVDHE